MNFWHLFPRKKLKKKAIELSCNHEDENYQQRSKNQFNVLMTRVSGVYCKHDAPLPLFF